MMRAFVAAAVAVIMSGVASTVSAVAQFRGQIATIDPATGTATVSYYGNPSAEQGMPLFAHDAYGKTKAKLTLIEKSGGQVIAKVDSGLETLQCGNFVSSYESLDASRAEYFAKYEYNVKIRYQQEPRYYDIRVDRVFEFERYLRFVWDDGRVYRVDAESIKEFQLAVDGEELVLTGILLKDDVETKADGFIPVSQLKDDVMAWQKTILDELRGLEFLVENRYRFTYRDIKAVEISDRGTGIPTSTFVKNYAISTADIKVAEEDSVGQLTSGTLQTEEVITAYPVLFRFDQYRRVMVSLQEAINKEVNQATPDLEEIERLRALLNQFEAGLTMQDIASVKVVIKDADNPTRGELVKPIELEHRGNSWQAKVNLTKGNYSYHYVVEVRAKPCNQTFVLQDPLNATGKFTVFSRVIPIQVNDMAARSSSEPTTPAPTAPATSATGVGSATN